MVVFVCINKKNHDFYYILQTILSAVVCCGPQGLTLRKPAVLSFEHCASLQHASWSVHLLASEDPSSATSPHKNNAMTSSQGSHQLNQLASHNSSSNNTSSSSYSYQSSQKDHWKRIITLGEERVDTPVYTQIDGNQVSFIKTT